MPIFLVLAFAYTAKLMVAAPALLCCFYAVALEWVLYRKDLTYLPLWRPALSVVILLVGRFVWGGWVTMAPVESILSLQLAQAPMLTASIAIFFIVLNVVIAALLYSSVHHLVAEQRLGNVDPKLTALRCSPILWVIVLWYLYMDHCNSIVGDNGLLALLIG